MEETSVLVARARREGCAEAAFRQAEAVVRGGVEVADARVPGGVDRRRGVLGGVARYRLPMTGGAEAEFGEAHRRPCGMVRAFTPVPTAGHRPSQPPSTGRIVPWT